MRRRRVRRERVTGETVGRWSVVCVVEAVRMCCTSDGGHSRGGALCVCVCVCVCVCACVCVFTCTHTFMHMQNIFYKST